MFGAAMLPLELALAGLLTDTQVRNAPQAPKRQDAARNAEQNRLNGEKNPKKTGRGDYPPLTTLGHIEVRRSPADASRYSLMLHRRVPLPGVDFLAAFFTFGGLTSS